VADRHWQGGCPAAAQQNGCGPESVMGMMQQTIGTFSRPPRLAQQGCSIEADNGALMLSDTPRLKLSYGVVIQVWKAIGEMAASGGAERYG